MTAMAALTGVVAMNLNTARADDDATVINTNGSTSYAMESSPYYHANEFSVDLFGMGAVNQTTLENLSSNRIRRRGVLGEGVGVNYFFCRYIGISGDTYSHDWYHDRLLDSAQGNVVLRLPITHTGLAPYIYGGAGHQFKGEQQTIEDAGAGLEFRFLRHLGVFVDARYVFAEQTRDYAVARAGLRLNF